MYSKTILSLALLVLLVSDTYGAADNKVSASVKGTRAVKIARRGARMLKDKTKTKDPKDGPKVPKDEPKTPKEPKEPEATKAPKATKATKGGTKAPTKAPKATKATKGGTKAPKATKAPKGGTKAPTKAPTPAEPITQEDAMTDINATDTNTTDTNTTNTDTTNTNTTDQTMNSNMTTTDTNMTDTNITDTNSTCVMDDDCGPNWFCMEKVGSCCEFNTTCRVEVDQAAVTNTASSFANVYGIMASVAIISVVMW